MKSLMICQVQAWDMSHKNWHQPQAPLPLCLLFTYMRCHLPTPSLGSNQLLGPRSTLLLCLATGAGQGHEVVSPTPGSLFFNYNAAFELIFVEGRACNCSSYPVSCTVWVSKYFMPQGKAGVQLESSLGSIDLWKANPWMHRDGFSMRWSGFKSVASEFVLGTVPTDKRGFAMVTAWGLCLDIPPIQMLPGRPFRASLPLQLRCVEKRPLCTHCPFNLCIQHRCGKLTAITLKKILYVLALFGVLWMKIWEPQVPYFYLACFKKAHD